jgi:hypothetical protein
MLKTVTINLCLYVHTVYCRFSFIFINIRVRYKIDHLTDLPSRRSVSACVDRGCDDSIACVRVDVPDVKGPLPWLCGPYTSLAASGNRMESNNQKLKN